MKKKKIENEWKGILQETQSNISTESVTSTGVNIENVKEFQSNNQSRGYNVNDLIYKDYEEVCKAGIKDWNPTYRPFTKEQEEKLKELSNQLPVNNSYKQKRIDFEFTPLTFWQLIPSVAINLHSNEIELTWLCFGMYIKFK